MVKCQKFNRYSVNYCEIFSSTTKEISSFLSLGAGPHLYPLWDGDWCWWALCEAVEASGHWVTHNRVWKYQDDFYRDQISFLHGLPPVCAE